MKYPTLYTKENSRQMVDTFKGYNHNLRIGNGEWFDMQNLTSDHYPVLSPRRKRGVYTTPDHVTGMIAKDALCYVDGRYFVMNEYRVDMGLSDEPKQLISMGAYVIILPDKKYINTLDLTDFGNIDASVTTTADVTFTLCTVDGADYAVTAISDTAPQEPADLAYWIDTSTTPHTLKQYSATSAVWVAVPTTYVKIHSTGIGRPFNQYDGVTISGITDERIQELNSTAVIWGKGDDYIVITGILDTNITTEVTDGAITIARKMPAVDYITESGNRLWGCRYGVANNGEVVNELYACKLGDFKNWNCFMGTATDSYAVSCGTDGPFTGAITHLGLPIFFKENCMHKVYGNYPANFQVQDTACRGVQKGCEKSLAIVNEVLYYKAQSGIVAYDGSLPTEVSYVFGTEQYSAAVAGVHGNKYYISMQKPSTETWHLFVYDAAKNLWHLEDDLQAELFCSCREELYAVDHRTGNIITMLGSGTIDSEPVEWMAESGEIGISSPDMKYISRMTVRLSLEVGSRIDFYAQYDLSDEWVHLGGMTGTSLRSFSLPIRPRRCDHMKLKVTGTGNAKIYSITKTIEQGRELS